MDSWIIDDDGNWTSSQSRSKSPVEKMRIRLAHEAYDGKYVQMEDTSEDKPSVSSEKKKQHSKSNCCGTRTVTPCVVMVAIGLILIVGFIILAIVLKLRINEISKVCQTPDCYITSGAILSKMDTTIDPCTDFYQYSCSAFNTSIDIPPDKVIYTTLGGEMLSTKLSRTRKILEAPGSEYKGNYSSAVAKARQFYSACMNISAAETQGNAPVLKMIKSLGSWTVSGEWNANTWSIESSVATANLYGLSPFFISGVETDDKNSSVTIISIDQEGLTLFDYESYIGNSSEKFHKAFVDYFVTTANLLGAGDNVQTLGEEVWQFEKELAQIFVRPEDREDVRKLYNLMSVSEIQSYFGSVFNVTAYLSQLYGSRMNWSKPILVRVPDYLRKLGKLMAAAKPGTMANYIGWQAVCSVVPYLSTPHRLASLQLKMTIYGVSGDTQRWELCATQADEAMGFATGALYVDQYFSEQDRLKVEDLVKIIWSEFKNVLNKNEWMDESTKNTAIDKAQSLLYKVGYPQFVTDVKQLDDYYSQLIATDSALQNALNAATFLVRKEIAKLGKPADKTRWSMTPATINAYYSSNLNQIVMPAGILQKPLYHESFPISIIRSCTSVGFRCKYLYIACNTVFEAK